MVSKEVVVYRSLLPYYALVLVVLLIWIVAGEELSQSVLLTAWSDPGGWFVLAAAVMATMLAPLILTSWRMKLQVSVSPIEWHLEEREIEYGEFEHLAGDYTRAYSHLQSRFDIPLVLMAAAVAAIALLLPLIIVEQFQQASGWAPHVFAMLLMVLGLTVLRVAYMALPNDATPSFPLIKARPLRAAVDLLRDTVGISWAGIRLSIGESAGYFTLRSPGAVGRIEGIENSAWVEVQADKLGVPFEAVAKVKLDSEEMKLVAPQAENGTSIHNQLDELVRSCIAEYVKAKGSDEILDEVMAELGMISTASTGTPDSVDREKKETNE
ncbi:MAG: hypothetical protein C4K47_09745 [Candidatus Thorarchaeota archaeon]|nr:MAG: hypothetical protein C4K47_09745 [Candidatus Thorarchaeota archaeon]